MRGTDHKGAAGAAEQELQKICVFMLQNRIAGLPRNFELVYEAFFGTNGELTHDLAELGPQPSQAALDQIGLKFRLAGHCGLTVERLQSDTIQTLGRMGDSLSLSMTQKRAFTHSIQGVMRSIREDTTAGIEQILEELDLLTSVAHDMIKAETLLTHEMTQCLDTLKSADRALKAAKGLVLRDRLTGLPNRQDFFQKLEHAHALASQAHGQSLILVEILDMQGLLQKFGEDGTNKLVHGLSSVFRKAIKKHDYIARIENDCFAFLFSDVGAEETHIIAERLFTTAENNLVFAAETEEGLALALGHAMAHDGGDPLNWLAHAKSALQTARLNPRQPVVGFKSANRPDSRNVA